jgi:hypothetical protein
MNVALADAGQFSAAVVLSGATLLLPGAAIASFTKVLREPGDTGFAMSALLLAVAVLPALLSLVARVAGLDVAIAVNLALALAGVFSLQKFHWPSTACIAGMVGWTIVVALALIDFSIGNRLYQTAIVLDMVKHAATINAIVDWGAPPSDPFVFRSQPAGYYYFFYVLAAVPVRLTGNLIDARAALGALEAWIGAALFCLSLLTWERCEFHPCKVKRAGTILALLLLARNLDIVPAALLGLSAGKWPINIEWWNEQVLSLPFSCIWVPHHVTAAICGFVSIIILAEPRPPSPKMSVVLAGAGFASCFGASVWVGLAVAVSCMVWLSSLAHRREWRAAASLMLAGSLAAILLVPQVRDIANGRADEGVGVAFDVRPFMPWDIFVPPGNLRELGRLILLPLNYFFEFGVFFIGSLIFWVSARPAQTTETSRAITLAALIGCLIGTFARSTILNNDLGYRAMLLPQFAALLWTAAATIYVLDTIKAHGTMRRHGQMLVATVILGYVGNLYSLFSIRASPFLGAEGVIFADYQQHPEIDFQLRRAYAWLDSHEPSSAVVQHNPVSGKRIFDFGLYGRNRVAVADSDANLFGASRLDVRERIDDLAPIFAMSLPLAQVKARADAERIDILVVSAADPVWDDRSSWVWSTPAIYASDSVRLIAVRDIGEDRGR